MSAPEEDWLEQNRRRQRELYGQTLHDRLRAVMLAYAIPQKRLAEVLGVSAPMLSQLMSARRVKMGNPRAHERMIALEQRAGEHGAPPLPSRVAATITAQIASEDSADTAHLRARHGTDAAEIAAADLVQALRTHVGATELRAARDLLGAQDAAPTLRAFLARALS